MNEQDEKIVTLSDVFSNMRRDRKLVACITAAIFCLSIFVAFQKDDIYESVAILAPNANMESNAAMLNGNLSRFASLAGFNINGIDDDTKQYIAMLQAGDFLIPFIRKNHIKREIYRNRFDEVEDTWKGPTPIQKFFKEIRKLISSDKYRSEKKSLEPTDVEVVKSFKKNFLSVSFDRQSGLISVSVRAYHPELAYQYTKNIVKSINEFTRDQKLKEARSMIKFLTKEIAESHSIEIKNSSSNLIESQLKTIMLANTREDFAFKLIDSPRISEEKVSPNRISIVILGLLVGFVFSFMVVTAKTLRK